jgi:hypothetical protein
MTIERLNEALKLRDFDPEKILAEPDGFDIATEDWMATGMGVGHL